MASNGIPMFFELCRLCLKNPGENLIFEIDSMPDDIFVYTGVRVSSTDNLPQKVCSSCQDVISKIKDLRILAISNDSHLRFLFDDGPPPEIDSASVSYSVKIKQHNVDNELPSSTTSQNPTKMKLSVRKDLFDSTNEEKEKSKTSSEEEESQETKDGDKSESHKRKRHKERNKKKKKDRERREKNKRRESESPKNSHSTPKIKLHETDKSKVIKRSKRSLSDDSNAEGKVYQCDTCLKVVMTWRQFYIHQRLHIKKFTCPFDACSKSFSTKGDLAKHVRTHTGEKPYACSVCDKSFAQNATLKGHMRAVHTGLVSD